MRKSIWKKLCSYFCTNKIKNKLKIMTENWIIYGFGSAICFTGMTLVFKKLLTMGVSPLVLNMFVFGISFLGFVVWNVVSKTKINIGLNIILFLILGAIFAIFGNYLDLSAVKNAPNPGYAGTLKATQIVLIAILSPILFNSSISLLKLVGIVLVLAGAAIISIF